MILFSTLLTGLEYGLQQNNSMVRYEGVFPLLKDPKIFSLVSSHFQVYPQVPAVRFTIHVAIIGFSQWCLILEQLFIDHLIRRDEVRNDQSHHLGFVILCFSLQKQSLVEIFSKTMLQFEAVLSNPFSSFFCFFRFQTSVVKVTFANPWLLSFHLSKYQGNFVSCQLYGVESIKVNIVDMPKFQ